MRRYRGNVVPTRFGFARPLPDAGYQLGSSLHPGFRRKRHGTCEGLGGIGPDLLDPSRRVVRRQQRGLYVAALHPHDLHRLEDLTVGIGDRR
jgi:hypothetical protein